MLLLIEKRNSMDDNKLLAELIFPNVKETIEDLEKRYPSRDLDDNAMVTRFAPSPTGFLHSGRNLPAAGTVEYDRQGAFVKDWVLPQVHYPSFQTHRSHW